MQVLAFLVKAYFALEDVYYSLTDALDKAGLPVYRFFVESVEEKGVPSFPVAAAVLFAVFAIGVVLAWTFFSATTAFQVNVSYKGVAVEGAVVTVAGDGFSQELETDSEGAAVFPGAKEGMRLSVAISKKGFKNKQTSVVVSNSVFIVKMGKERELEEEGDVWVSVIVGDGSGGAIAGAVVSFEAGERLDSGSTDSQGKYSFGVPSGVAVRVTVSKTGFETLSDSFYASEGFVKNVALRNVESDSRLSLRGLGFPVPRGGLNSNGSGDTEYSGVVVEVVASDGGDFSQAQVTLYNAFNDVELDAATAEPGQPALFSGVAVGTDAYVIVESSGFASAMAEFTLEREQTRLLVELDRLTSASFDNETGDLITEDGEVIHLNEETGEFTGEDGEPLSEEELASIGVLLDVQVVDDTGAPVSGAAVSLSGAIIRNRVTGASGIASFSDLPLASLQDISVSADGFLPFWSSSPFLAGSAPSFRVRLTRATGLNSGELSVRAYSLSPSGDLVLEGVAVSLEVNGQPYPGSETTNAQGIAVFPGLPVGSQVTANGVIDEFRGTNSTTTRSGQNQLDLLLMPLEYALHVQAVDSASGAVVAAHLKVYWGDSSTEENLFEECSTTLQSNCTFNLYTKVGYEIVASAQSYLSLSAFYTADDASTREADLQVMLLPASAPLVSYLGLYYENSSLAFAPDETAVLPPAGIYFARFALRLQQDSSETVFYTRVNKTTIPNLFIFESDSVFAPKLFDSVRSGACASPSDAPSGSAYSWIEARIPSGNYDGRQSVQFEVPIMANSSASERTSAFLDYRAASKTGLAFVTEPLDAGLTPANENAQRCTAATSRKEFTVPATSELKYSFACSDLGCLKISYEQGALSGGSGFNAVAGDEAGGLVISYNLIDFNPPVAETEADSFSFTLSNTRFAVDSPPFQPRSDYFDYNYAVFGGPYVIKGTWMSLPIALPSGEPLSDAIQPVNYYFKKQSTTAASLRVDLSLSYGGASAPQGGGSEYRYVLHHDSAVGQMGLYSSTDAAFGKPLSSIDLLVTPMLPADAIYLSLDRSSLPTPCGSGDLDLVRTSCFELDRVTGLLKYDASSSACTHYSKDPNKVSSAVQSVAFYPSCKGPLPQFTKSIEFRINTNNLYPALYAVPAWNADYNGILWKTDSNFVAPLQVIALVNNRQYGAIEPVEVVLQTKRIQMDSAFLRGGVRAMVMPFARPAETNFGENTGVNVGGQAASNVFYHPVDAGKLVMGDWSQAASNVFYHPELKEVYTTQEDAQEILLEQVYRDKPASENGFPYSALSTRLPEIFFVGGVDFSNSSKCAQISQHGLFEASVAPLENTPPEGQGGWTFGSRVLSIPTESQCPTVSLCGTHYFVYRGCAIPANNVNGSVNSVSECVKIGQDPFVKLSAQSAAIDLCSQFSGTTAFCTATSAAGPLNNLLCNLTKFSASRLLLGQDCEFNNVSRVQTQLGNDCMIASDTLKPTSETANCVVYAIPADGAQNNDNFCA